MILYLDTSALVKKYFQERFSDHILSLWKQAGEVITSTVAYAETLAAFHRKKREADFSADAFRIAVEAFKLDWKGFFKVEVTEDLNEIIDRVLGRHPLRGFDAIHLASSLLVREYLHEDLLFSCFDQRLTQAAADEGLNTFPPADKIPSA
jgi:predicted nucleic acid-binding protein